MASVDRGVAFRLRPLGVGDLVDEALKLYRGNFRLLMTLTIVPLLPVVVLTAIWVAVLGASASALGGINNLGSAAVGARILENLAGLGLALVLGLVTTLVSLVAYCFVNGATTYAVSQRFLGRVVTPEECFREVRRHLGALILWPILLTLALFVVMFIVVIASALLVGGGDSANSGRAAAAGLGICGGFALLIFGGIYLGIKLSVTNAAIVLENLGATAGLGRSWRLLDGHWWRAFLTLLVIGFVTYLISLLPSLAGSLLSQPFVNSSDPLSSLAPIPMLISTIFNLIAQILSLPLSLIGVTLLYYDLRVRKEGFDLEVMAQHLGGGGDAFPGGDASPPLRPTY